MQEAIFKQDVEMVKYMLAQRCAVNQDIFLAACKQGNVEIVNLLIAYSSFDPRIFPKDPEALNVADNREVIDVLSKIQN